MNAMVPRGRKTDVPVIDRQLRQGEKHYHIEGQTEPAGDLAAGEVDLLVNGKEHIGHIDGHQRVGDEHGAEQIRPARHLDGQHNGHVAEVRSGQGGEALAVGRLAKRPDENVEGDREEIKAEKVHEVQRPAVGDQEL